MSKTPPKSNGYEFVFINKKNMLQQHMLPSALLEPCFKALCGREALINAMFFSWSLLPLCASRLHGSVLESFLLHVGSSNIHLRIRS